ncbi:hypothetical protein SUGI_0624310 [Cryptomeria japonica]|nr:hypothetical protein SUGI_0624310 [Cryptomeria japonica]
MAMKLSIGVVLVIVLIIAEAEGMQERQRMSRFLAEQKKPKAVKCKKYPQTITTVGGANTSASFRLGAAMESAPISHLIPPTVAAVGTSARRELIVLMECALTLEVLY